MRSSSQSKLEEDSRFGRSNEEQAMKKSKLKRVCA